MKRLLAIAILALTFYHSTFSQNADTVEIHVGDSSKVTFRIQNKKDLETLKKYDFQAVVHDLVSKLEQRDSSSLKKPASDYLTSNTSVATTDTAPEEENWEENTYRSKRDRRRDRYHYRRRTYHSINFDLGTNNYLSDGKFPDENNNLYSVKPWGSWYVGINSIQRSRVAGKFFVEWGGGVSWYNFKFQNPGVLMSKDNNSVLFTEDPRDVDFKKSKLTACYLNLSLVPVIDFGGNRRKSMMFDSDHSESVRFGAGPYIGYRIGSYTKQVYKEEGDKQKDRNHDSFYLDNIRYGVRFQFGFSDVDLFFNYDLNELFVANKGPKLNAFSFGITL
ncbi:MAG: hypothetical protein DI538_10795 [Azospira oryzae]|nr:MAG: hypothetical protein DI538_10795 [Azospira oryzae]